MAISLTSWIQERLDNCHRIAAGKSGSDRDGWLEDATYFAGVLMALAEADRLKALNEALGKKVSDYASQLDKAYGTPCAEIRWQQEKEELLAQIASLELIRDELAAGEDL